jgi:hypothetical protein
MKFSMYRCAVLEKKISKNWSLSEALCPSLRYQGSRRPETYTIYVHLVPKMFLLSSGQKKKIMSSSKYSNPSIHRRDA